MAVGELVKSIQSVFPPSGQIPLPTSNPRTDSAVEELPPVQRHPIPGWIEPGKGTPFPSGSVLVIEEVPQPVQQNRPTGIDVDVLAYYLPFHFYTEEWGIYLRASGVLSIASMLEPGSKRGPAGDLLRLASGILLQHERFHFLSEVACGRLELISGASELYRDYFHDRGATVVEEALANAYALRTLFRRRSAALRDRVEQWMGTQGPGYRDFARCLASSAFSKHCRIAVQRMQNTDKRITLSSGSLRVGSLVLRPTAVQAQGSVFPWGGRSLAVPTEFLFAGVARSTVPIRIVLDVAGVGVLRPFLKYAGMRILVHANDHPPPHLHVEMPPGRDFTRLEWPALQPLPGAPALSVSQRKAVDKYLSRYGEQIDKKIRQVYRLPAR